MYAPPTLKNLWEDIIAAGFDVRSERRDGLKFWQPYKLKYVNYILEGYENNIHLKESFKDLSESLNYKYTSSPKDQSDAQLDIAGTKLDNKIETNHFLIQHFRIPKIENYNLPLVKILQIAYNVGQLKAVFENEKVFDNKIKEFYYGNNLDNISTYVNSDIYNSSVIGHADIQMGSSRYQKKYFKYKKKYLKLKNTL